MRRLLTACLLLTVPLAAMAEPDGITISNAWSRAAMAGHTGVVYLTVTDAGPPDRLTGVTSPVAAQAGLHESFDDHGVMKMRPVVALPVAPGVTLTLAPNGYHIMLTGLKQPLKPGDSFPVVLQFEKAGSVTTTATVRAGAEHGPGMPMHGMSAH